MTIAVLRANGDLLWMDAITQYTKNYTGTLSAHPLEKGSVVNDHTTINNLKISLAGIISDADFNLDRPTISDSDATNWGINNKQFVNNSPVTDTVTVTMTNTISSFLPASVTQFIVPQTPVVTVPIITRPKFADKVKQELVTIHETAENFSLVEFKHGSIDTIIYNCVLVGLEFTETPESGDAVYPTMNIEQAKYVTTKTVAYKNKGRKTTTATTRDTVSTDGAGATTFSEKSQGANAVDDFNSPD